MTALLVASTGGHLAQLHLLAARLLPRDQPRLWVTFDGPQARSLLAGEALVTVPYIGPRGYRGIVKALPTALKLLQTRRIDRVLSTGAAIALAFIPLARAHRIPCTYIESAARADGPSLTGRLLSAVPGVQTYTQYRNWANGNWRLGPSVFDSFQPSIDLTSPRTIRKVVVTLGTQEGYQFRALLERLVEILPSEAEVLWQTGSTRTSGLPIRATTFLPHETLLSHMLKADLVIAHAGVGSALTALTAGHCPVLVPRRSARGEHVDDHQRLIAMELADRRLAVVRDLDDLESDALHLATSRRTLSADAATGSSSPRAVNG